MKAWPSLRVRCRWFNSVFSTPSPQSPRQKSERLPSRVGRPPPDSGPHNAGARPRPCVCAEPDRTGGRQGSWPSRTHPGQEREIRFPLQRQFLGWPAKPRRLPATHRGNVFLAGKEKGLVECVEPLTPLGVFHKPFSPHTPHMRPQGRIFLYFHHMIS